MRFLVDEQLPPLLTEILRTKGFESDQVATLGIDRVMTDQEIIKMCMVHEYTLITKDVDFLNSFLLLGEPSKLIYVITGNIKNRELLDLFRKHIDQVITQLRNNHVIEVSRIAIRVLH